MTEIRFYHLQRKSVEQAVPELVERAYAKGHRIVVRLADAGSVDRLNDALWIYRPDSFLPHGTVKEGQAEHQPIWLTAGNDNPNKADVIILTGGTECSNLNEYTLCCEILDGQNPEQVENARTRWKTYKSQGHTITYWQQNDAGKWEQKS